MGLDDILRHTGEFGRYQIRVYSLVCIVTIYNGLIFILFLYTTADMPHTCKIPETIFKDVATEETNNMTNLWAEYNISATECHYYVNGTKAECNVWNYDTSSTFTSTTISQFNMVCNDKIWKANVRMVHMAGYMLGALVFGFVGDRFGRKKMLLLSLFTSIGSKLMTTCSPNLHILCLFTLTSGAGLIGVYTSSFNIGMEFVGVSKRFHAGSIIVYFSYMGESLGALMSFLVRDWIHLTLATVLPGVGLISLWWLLPESPRWLISKGRESEANEIVKHMARVNKVPLYDGYIDDMTRVAVNTKHLSILHIFRHRSLVWRQLIIIINWISTAFLFYGITIMISEASENMQLNMFLSVIFGTMGAIINHVCANRIGRKRLYIGSVIGAGVSCVCTIFPRIYLTQSHLWVTLLLSLIGKMTMATAFSILYIHTSEMMPTAFRTTGMCSASMIGRIGSIVAPYVADIDALIGGGRAGKALPYLIFGCAALISAVLSCFLPETFNKQLPETIADSLNLDKKTRNMNELNQELEVVELDVIS